MTLTNDRPPTWDPEPPWDPDYDPPAAARNGTGGRTPPQNIDAERSVLGAMLISPQAITDTAGHLEPSDFSSPHHETIYDVITDLASAGQPVDMVTVAAELAKRPHTRGRTQLDNIGGATYLHTLAHGVPLAAHATQYAKLVRDTARLRAFVDVGTKLTQLGHTADPDRVDAYLGEAVQTLDDAVQRFGPTQGTTGPGTGLVDLSWVASGGQAPRQPSPTYVERTDGTALFYAGQVNGVFGDPEHGKTWLAQLAIVQALNAGGTAAMIDVDHNGPDASAARLLLLGARPEDLADPTRFRYYEPQESQELLNAVAEVTLRADNVLLLDSIGEVFGLLGVNPNDEIEVTKAMRTTCTRPAMAGSCVLIVDHLPKGHEARNTGFAIGSIAKKRMIRGAYIRADARQKPIPGGIGRISLRIEKDTMGELRRSSGGGYAGTLTLDSTRDYALEWHIGRDEMPKNPDGTARPTTLMDKVAAYVEHHPNCSQRDIEDAIQGTAKYIRQALQVLVNEGHINRVPGKGRTFHHTLEIPYREAEDDHAH